MKEELEIIRAKVTEAPGPAKEDDKSQEGIASTDTATDSVARAESADNEQEKDVDSLKNPSARIVVGKLSTVGTGAFDVLCPVR